VDIRASKLVPSLKLLFLKMKTEMFAETLETPEHHTRCISKIENSYTKPKPWKIKGKKIHAGLTTV
jgi:hypothetical protein